MPPHRNSPFLRRSVLLLACLAAPGAWRARAINASPAPVEVQQADGSTVKLRVFGNPSIHWHEDEAGYTVVRHEGNYVYALPDGRGGLMASGLVAGRENPAGLGLSKRLQPEPLKRRKLMPNAAPGSNGPAEAESGPLLVPPAGTVKNLVVLCRFSNHTPGVHTRDEADYNTIFNTVGGDPALAPTGSVRDYFTENSYGAMTLQSTVTVWVTLPQTESYYANGADGLGSYPNNAQKMVQDALALVDATVNFGQFDQDNDGFIDAISVIHSGYGAETGGGGGNWIWSHRWALPTNWTSADNNGAGVKVKVRDYHTEPALWGTSGTAPVRISVICHETGHFFGLPDLYDTDNSSAGIGSWCLMANAWSFDGSQLYPPHFSAWCKAQLGWLTPTVIGEGTHSVPQVETNQAVFKITAGFPSGEYLLVENRQPAGFEPIIPQGGLAIWHIDDTKSNNNLEGYPGQAGWPGNGNHYKVALLQADGLYEMEKNIDRGDAGDLYHAGGVSVINGITVPNTNTYQGGVVTSSGVVISGISASGATMTFDLTFDNSAPEINVTGNGVTIVDGDSTPGSTDHTSFGAIPVSGGMVVRTFTIQNTGAGSLNLTGTPKVVVGGTNAADFTVTADPVSPVAAATGATVFQVTFDPAAGGTRTATLSIANDDANENPYNFSISGTGAVPEIRMEGNGLNISDGDTSPRSADGTDFGSASVAGGSITGTFTIENSGAGDLFLTGTPRVVVGGANAADFTISVQPASPVAASGSTTFQVVFNPVAGGTRNATLSITNDDSNENPFDFSIRGTGTLPEINVTGNGVDIADGDATPSVADFTDFGSVTAATGPVVRTFTIQNSGPGNLSVPAVTVSGADAADFSVTTLPAPLVAASGSTTFAVTFSPLGSGVRDATLNIANNDADENPCDFAIRGTSIINSAPTDIVLTPASFPESNAANVTVGLLTGTDPDPGQSASLTFTLVSGAGSTDNAAFAITGTSLEFLSSADFETRADYSIRVRATDSGSPGLTYDEVIIVSVTDVNEAPSDITLSAASLAENNPAEAAVGSLTAADPDAGATHVFSLVSGPGDTDNAAFTIVGSELKLSPSADFETQAAYSVRVRATDAGGLPFEKQFAISISDANDAPADITLSASSLAENNVPGVAAGTLGAADADAGDAHSFSLVSGAGDTDNAAFTIVGSELKLTPSADFETQAAYSVRVLATDAGGLTHEKPFTVTITDGNEPPGDISLSAASIAENNAAGATVGTLSAADADAGDTHTFTLVSGTGDTDNAAFTIEGSELKLSAPANFEAQSSYSVRVLATDAGGLTHEKPFTVTITDGNEPPGDISLSAASIAENNAAGATVGTLSAADADAGDTHTFTLVSGAGDTDNAAFTIDGSELKLSAPANFEAQSSYSVRILATDAGGMFFEKQFLITVTDVPENMPPSFSGYVLLAQAGVPAIVSEALVLARAADPDGGTPAIQSVAASTSQGGSVTADTASFVYAPPAGFTGLDTFTVTVTDGQGGSVQGLIMAAVIEGAPPVEPQPMMSWQPNGSMALLFHGAPGHPYQIQRSTDFLTWAVIASAPAATDGTFPFLDPAPAAARALYRCVPP